MFTTLVIESLLVVLGLSPELPWLRAEAASEPQVAPVLEHGSEQNHHVAPTGFPTGRLDTDSARRATARAFAKAADDLDLRARGYTWIGKLDSVGRSTRDVIVYVPAHLDRTRPIELVVYMEGYRSFSRRAIRERHAAGIEKLLSSSRNFVYIAPDVPSSAHGDAPEHKGPVWSARCADGKPCRGGNLAPGDFVGFHSEITAMLDRGLFGSAQAKPGAPRYTLSLIGFSAGGGGVFTAVRQLAHSTGAVSLDTVALRRVVFADAIYSTRWLDTTWERVRDLPGLAEFSLLLMNGPLTGPRAGTGAGGRNRINAARFIKRYRPGLDLDQQRGRSVSDGNVYITRLRASHRGIGDRAVYLSALAQSLTTAAEPLAQLARR